MLYIGIDLGTSAVKLLLMNEAGEILHVVSRDYPLEFPRPAGASRTRRTGRRPCGRESPFSWRASTGAR